MNKIKSVAPGLHVSIKLNCNDFTRGGIDGEDFIENCKLLDAERSAATGHQSQE